MDPQNNNTYQDLNQVQNPQQDYSNQASSGYIKSEGGFSIASETTSAYEITPVPEVQKSVEKAPSIETETFVPLAKVVQTQKQEEVQTVATSKPTEEKLNIVDKTNQIASLHHIQHPHDKITDLADREEEEFIKDVKAAHQHDHEH